MLLLKWSPSMEDSCKALVDMLIVTFNLIFFKSTSNIPQSLNMMFSNSLYTLVELFLALVWVLQHIVCMDY